MIYKLRIMIRETYVRITMIGYESKRNDIKSRIAFNAVLPGEVIIHELNKRPSLKMRWVQSSE